MEDINRIDIIGNWSSIIALGISFLTLCYAFFINRKVINIKKRVMFNTRVSPLLKDFKSYSLKIMQLYEEFDGNKNELKVEIAKCRVQLESIVSKIPNDQKKEFETQISKLKRAQKSTLGEQPVNFQQKWYKRKILFKSKDDIWEIYVGLIACANKLDNLIKDKTII